MLLSRTPLLAAGLLACTVLAGCATHTKRELVRYPIPNSNFPISRAVEVPAHASTVYLSGMVPPKIDDSKPNSDPTAYGADTEAQTVGVLQRIQTQLESMGLTMGDVVKMQVFLVKDPAKGNRMDFAGFMKGYTQFFGTAAQPKLPARSAFEIAALGNPAWFVEIEVVAVRSARRTR